MGLDLASIPSLRDSRNSLTHRCNSVMGDFNSSRFHEEKMGGSGRSHNTDLHRCLLDIDLFDLPARSILGPTAEIVSRLLPGSLTEYWLMTVGLLPSRTLKQTSQGQVFLPLPSGRSWSQGRSLLNSFISGPPTKSLPLLLSKF